MAFIKKSRELQWTIHARAKMNHYRLTPSRVRHVLHSPRRVEEGIAPKTIAMMQPASSKRSFTTSDTRETWTQEIWVMVQDKDKTRKVISAWRYPGITKPRGTAFLKQEYREFLSGEKK